MLFKTILYGTEEYAQTLALRNRVMRIPLGRSIYDEDFRCEAESDILGAFSGGDLLGVCVMSCKEGIYKIEYLCVQTEKQKTGIGRRLLGRMEERAKSRGAGEMLLDARVSAQGFYEACGYSPYGEEFLMTIAPVPHIKMKKEL